MVHRTAPGYIIKKVLQWAANTILQLTRKFLPLRALFESWAVKNKNSSKSKVTNNKYKGALCREKETFMEKDKTKRADSLGQHYRANARSTMAFRYKWGKS